MRRLNDPSFHVRFNVVMLAVWTALLVPSLLLWREAVVWIVVMSHYANIAAHLAALMGAKAEEKADH